MMTGMDLAPISAEQAAEVSGILRGSPVIRTLLERWNEIGLPDGWLAAGAVAQTVWNHAFKLSWTHGLSDIDIVYFDALELSEDTEARHAARVNALFPELPVRIDLKNQARVHAWYQSRFSYPIQPYASVEDAIATFPTTVTAIGVRPEGDHLRLVAPFGVADLLNLTVRANRRQITRPVYEAKVKRWLSFWPHLHIVAWDEETGGSLAVTRT